MPPCAPQPKDEARADALMAMALFTLDKMAAGGIYDHLGVREVDEGAWEGRGLGGWAFVSGDWF